jgi:hypothetical protein
VLAWSRAKRPAMWEITLEQQRIFQQALDQGLIKNAKEAFEVGAAALRRQLQKRKAQAAATEAEAMIQNQLRLF